MLSNILVLAVLSMLALGSAGKIPDQIMNRPPQIVAVMKPDQTPVLQRSKQALDELVLPPGNSPCGTQISALATMARSCLGNRCMSYHFPLMTHWIQAISPPPQMERTLFGAKIDLVVVRHYALLFAMWLWPANPMTSCDLMPSRS